MPPIGYVKHLVRGPEAQRQAGEAGLRRLIPLLNAIRVERPHEQFIELKVVAGGVGLERAPKLGRDAEVQGL